MLNEVVFELKDLWGKCLGLGLGLGRVGEEKCVLFVVFVLVAIILGKETK